jgi:hypothetical protein
MIFHSIAPLLSSAPPLTGCSACAPSSVTSCCRRRCGRSTPESHTVTQRGPHFPALPPLGAAPVSGHQQRCRRSLSSPRPDGRYVVMASLTGAAPAPQASHHRVIVDAAGGHAANGHTQRSYRSGFPHYGPYTLHTRVLRRPRPRLRIVSSVAQRSQGGHTKRSHERGHFHASASLHGCGACAPGCLDHVRPCGRAVAQPRSR